jgi:hypothetical protein
MKKVFGALALCATGGLLVVLGCNKTAPNATITPVDYTKDPGEAPTSQAAYPDGPYGVAVGSVVPNLKYYGFHNPQTSSDTNNLEDIELAQFYNPTGSDMWPADSTYRPGEAKPKVLWIDVSAQWCPPCQEESAVTLPADYKLYQPQGAEILLELIEDTNGNPALPVNLVQWTTKYKTAWPAVIDPSRQTFTLAPQDAYPDNIVVDTKTMKVLYKVAGAAIPCSLNTDCSAGGSCDMGTHHCSNDPLYAAIEGALK